MNTMVRTRRAVSVGVLKLNVNLNVAYISVDYVHWFSHIFKWLLLLLDVS